MKPVREPRYSQMYVDMGNGQPIILLHGLFGNMAMWRATINALRKGYRIIVPRLPLFDVPIDNANVDSLVEILHEFISWHELRGVTLVGTDIGGQTALHYAYKYPTGVKRIIISGSSGLFENLPELDRESEREYDSVRNLVNNAFFRPKFAGTAVVDKVYATVNTFSKNRHISAFARSSRANDISKFLYKLEHPVLLIWGVNDKITPPEIALHLHDLLCYSSIKLIDECGHLPMVEKASLYVKYVREFLESDPRVS